MQNSRNFVLVFCALVVCALLFAATAHCQTPVHKADLTWGMSPDQVANPTLSITYNVYRLDGACPADGSYSIATATKLASNLSVLLFTDTTVKVAQTYCYAVTASLNTQESGAQPASGTIPLARIPVTVSTK